MASTPELPLFPGPPARERLTLDLSAQVSLLLDHISQVTGSPRSQIAVQALLEALPHLVERADAIKKRSNELGQVKGKPPFPPAKVQAHANTNGIPPKAGK